MKSINLPTMTPRFILVRHLLILAFIYAYSMSTHAADTLQVIVIGAHPDDCDICAGGTAIQWAKMGHQVKFLSLTNGDAGHQSMGGGALARRRRAESQEVARRLGIAEYEVLDNHDGELVPSLEVRKQVIKAIREWKADVVILPRPNDYHPDHRNTGLVVQDAAYMVIVPNVVTEVPPLEKNPVFLYCRDRFSKPNPFSPDIAVDIDAVYDQKTYALDAHQSQFYEWLPWTAHRLDEVPSDPVERLNWLGKIRKRTITEEIRHSLTRWYGPERGPWTSQAEAFEICEYGNQPTVTEIHELFPMLPNPARDISGITALSATDIVIDGHLREAFYDKAPPLFLQNSLDPDDLVPSTYQSFAQVGYDKNYLYIAFTCFDTDIYSTFTKRDQRLWEQEVVEVFIDTDDNPNDYVELEVSPANILYDSWIDDPRNITSETADFNLDDIHTAVQVFGTLNERNDQDRKWTVEMAIPLTELSSEGTMDTREWRINLYRINNDAYGPRLMAYSPTGGSFHQPDKFTSILIDPASEEEWRPLFNGQDLKDWRVKIRGYELDDNYAGTFGVQDGAMTVSYDEYEGDYNSRFGHIFYNEPFSYYRIKVEYRFRGNQISGGPGWAFRNSGIMLHCQDPESMKTEQDFPVSIEAQLLGGNGKDPRSTMNLCTPGTNVVMNGELITTHCLNSGSETFHGDGWVTAEALVLGDSIIRHFVNGEQVIEYGSPQYGGGNVSPADPGFSPGTPLAKGYISLQSESHPIEFRRVELLNLDGCMDPEAINYKSYYIKSKPEDCRY